MESRVGTQVDRSHGRTMTDVLKSLLDRVELSELMNRYAAAIDLRDWPRLRSVFVVWV